ncbi:MAG: hypothetical protein GY753_17005 [Gammaproteobacteria bacterium]|nr:hypothetical protein [Gammaproteobacteria bacterium]
MVKIGVGERVDRIYRDRDGGRRSFRQREGDQSDISQAAVGSEDSRIEIEMLTSADSGKGGKEWLKVLRDRIVV